MSAPEEPIAESIARARDLAARRGLGFVDLAGLEAGALPTRREVERVLAADFLQRAPVLPLVCNAQLLRLALAADEAGGAIDKTAENWQQQAQRAARIPLEWVIAPRAPLLRLRQDWLQGAGRAFDWGNVTLATESVSGDAPEDAPIARFVLTWLGEAWRRGASDVHFEPHSEGVRVRLRIHGHLVEVARAPSKVRERLAARLKVIARLDIAERRVPQDGKIRLTLEGEAQTPGTKATTLDLRISTLPVLHGEKVAVRLLRNTFEHQRLEELGYEAAQLQQILRALQRPQGMILATGPTGAGKTRSLYACLERLNNAERNCSSVEDPVEIEMPGINQVQVNEKAGLSFAAAVRAFLRQDPDVIMIGEMRDAETAEVAVKAAQTGHLVLSTLHANSAEQVPVRLRNLDLVPYNIASSLTLVTAQRLVRRLCPHCRERASEPAAQALAHAGCSAAEIEVLLQQLGTPPEFFRAHAAGCEHCLAGFAGRIGFFQVLPVSEALREELFAGAPTARLQQIARAEGVLPLPLAGMLRAARGSTTLEEVLSQV